MATIAENLQILVNNKADIKEAIENLLAEEITPRMSAWADLLNAYAEEAQDASSNNAFPFRFPITFKPEQTISRYFPFSLPLTFTPPPHESSV